MDGPQYGSGKKGWCGSRLPCPPNYVPIVLIVSDVTAKIPTCQDVSEKELGRYTRRLRDITYISTIHRWIRWYVSTKEYLLTYHCRGVFLYCLNVFLWVRMVLANDNATQFPGLWETEAETVGPTLSFIWLEKGLHTGAGSLPERLISWWCLKTGGGAFKQATHIWSIMS